MHNYLGGNDLGGKVISEDMRVRIAHSIGSIERQRHTLAARILERVNAPEATDGSPDPDIVAGLLINLLIDGGGDIAAFGGLRDLSQVALKHRQLGINGRHYSRFGLALAPTLRSVLGLSMPEQSLVAWGDAFWLIVGGIVQHEPSSLSLQAAPSGTGRA